MFVGNLNLLVVLLFSIIIFFFQCSDFKNYSPVVEFDGANGVGALKMKDAIAYLDCTLVVNMHNDDTSNTEKLNLNV